MINGEIRMETQGVKSKNATIMSNYIKKFVDADILKVKYTNEYCESKTYRS